mmetsp:Transcript_1038/g.1850  ORF Transcript_1038/g.1850 Transcript_1038/m.1850 type:complete len:218 (-) Transcript_1038:484-1137(-)
MSFIPNASIPPRSPPSIQNKSLPPPPHHRSPTTNSPPTPPNIEHRTHHPPWNETPTPPRPSISPTPTSAIVRETHTTPKSLRGIDAWWPIPPRGWLLRKIQRGIVFAGRGVFRWVVAGRRRRQNRRYLYRQYRQTCDVRSNGRKTTRGTRECLRGDRRRDFVCLSRRRGPRRRNCRRGRRGPRGRRGGRAGGGCDLRARRRRRRRRKKRCWRRWALE